MQISLLFWILMIMWFVFGLWSNPGPFNVKVFGNSVLLFILLALIGWKLFGPALRG